MNKKTIVSLICALALSTLAACGGGSSAANVAPERNTAGTGATTTVVAPEANTQPAATTASTNSTTTVVAGAATAAQGAGASSVADALSDNSQVHETSPASEPSATETLITLNGDSIDAAGDGVKVTGSKATITAAGTYRISGKLADGQIVVDTEDEEEVRLILDGVDIRNSTGAAIDVASAEVAVIVLAEGKENFVTDGESYVFEDAETDEPNAAIFSKADLTITGDGALAVAANFNDGIASKDGLVIAGGTIVVDAADDGIRGKDYLVIKDGAITITAQGDGLKSDNEEDATKGYISIEAGVFDVTAAGDAIQAQTDVTIGGGEFELAAGGGSGAEIDEATSAKGLKAGVNVVIEGGAFAIDSADDAVHSNGALTVNGGTFDIATGDDAMHAGSELTVNGGEIDITRSYEGIESAVITLNGGDLHVVSSDDGLNVAGGNDGSGMAGAGQPAPGGRPGRGGGPRQDASATSNQILRINGGQIVVEAGGDGIDINGAVEMTGGVLIVHGPTQNMNAALDYDRSFKMTGGYLIAVGSSGMAQAPDESSSQLSILVNLSSPLQSGALIHLQASDGTEIFTFEPAKAYQSIAFSSPDLVEGATYLLYGGGSSTGSAKDGLYEGGAYSPGSQLASLTLSGTVTRLGGRSRY